MLSNLHNGPHSGPHNGSHNGPQNVLRTWLKLLWLSRLPRSWMRTRLRCLGGQRTQSAEGGLG